MSDLESSLLLEESMPNDVAFVLPGIQRTLGVWAEPVFQGIGHGASIGLLAETGRKSYHFHRFSGKLTTVYGGSTSETETACFMISAR